MAAIQSPQTLARRQSSAGRSLPSFQLACQSNLPGAPSQGRCWDGMPTVTGSMAFSLFEGGDAAPRPKGVIPQRAAAADPGHRRSPAPPLQSAHHLYQSAFCLFISPPLHPAFPSSPPICTSTRLSSVNSFRSSPPAVPNQRSSSYRATKKNADYYQFLSKCVSDQPK